MEEHCDSSFSKGFHNGSVIRNSFVKLLGYLHRPVLVP